MASGLLVGCASLDPWSQPPAAQRLQRDDTVGDCVRRFQASDILIDAAGTRDVQAVRVEMYKVAAGQTLVIIGAMVALAQVL